MWQWEQRHWCGPGDVRAVGCGCGSRDTGVALEMLGLLDVAVGADTGVALAMLGLLDVAVGAETLVWPWRC